MTAPNAESLLNLRDAHKGIPPIRTLSSVWVFSVDTKHSSTKKAFSPMAVHRAHHLKLGSGIRRPPQEPSEGRRPPRLGPQQVGRHAWFRTNYGAGLLRVCGADAVEAPEGNVPGPPNRWLSALGRRWGTPSFCSCCRGWS